MGGVEVGGALPGERRPVAQPEEGLQDELGKHHICWESAIDHCDWHAVVAAEVSLAEPVDVEKKKAVGTPAYIAERLAWARVERAFQRSKPLAARAMGPREKVPAALLTVFIRTDLATQGRRLL